VTSLNAVPREADTIVIGAGTGGSALTGVLARHSNDSVLLLEAGPDYGSYVQGNWPSDLLDARAIPLSHDWELNSGSTIPGRILDFPRARVVGGCSAHNGCTASVGAREDYDDWQRQGNPGWSSADVDPLLHWVRDALRVRRYAMEDLTAPQAAFVHAGLATGLPFADDLDDLDAGVGIGPMPVNVLDGVRWNAAFAFLDPVRDLQHLSIAARTTVRRLRIEHGEVTGVEVDAPGGVAMIHAGRVVIAAGAYQSPALLLRSGIGAADELRALSIDPVLDLPGVGAHLLDHSCVQLDFHGKDGLLEELAALQWAPDEQTVGRAKSSRCDTGPYDIHVFMVAGANSGHPGLPPISLYGGAMRARSDGRVTVQGPDPHLLPLIDHRYATDDDGYDRIVLEESLALLREMTAQPELAAILGAEATETQLPLTQVVSYCHPAGSCKMGPDHDPLAVVGADGQVHGIAGLFIADASIMPSVTRGNINLPTAMIGARIAAGLLKLTPDQVAVT
jgi:choline dehydrogenase